MVNRIVNTRFPKLNTDNLVINSVQIDTSNASTSQALVFDGTKFAPGSVGGGATVSNTAPTSPSEGDFWFDSTDSSTYVYYDSSWVAVGPAIPDQIGEIIAAKGDLIVANTASTATRLPVGTNGYYLRANSSTTTGLEWGQVSSYLSTQEIFSNYDVEAAWHNSLIEVSPFSDSLIRIQTNATISIPVGTQIGFVNTSSYVVTFQPQSGVTMRSKNSATKIAVQYGVATLVKTDTNEWYLFGDISV